MSQPDKLDDTVLPELAEIDRQMFGWTVEEALQ